MCIQPAFHRHTDDTINQPSAYPLQPCAQNTLAHNLENWHHYNPQVPFNSYIPSDMSTHQSMGLISHMHFSQPVHSQFRQYPSPHHSPPLDMGKRDVSHGSQWDSGSPAPAYPHLEDYSTHHYSSIEASYQDHGLSVAPVQHTPLSPPVSEGFMSSDLNNQDPHQAWPWTHPYGAKGRATSMSLIDSSPLLGVSAYNSGNMEAIQQAQPILGERRATMGGLFPDVLGQVQRKKRRLTKPDEAKYRCQTCGKCFSRVWNYNAHRETHNPGRPKPHTCTVPNCEKSFVRRTDLTRHVQCVHAKDKKFKCSLCNNRFARKDTLRRHEDDGCPKRIDIQSRNGKGSIPINSRALSSRHSLPQEYLTYTCLKPHNQQQPVFHNGSSPSLLPPLFVALNGSQTQQGDMLMS